MKAGLHLGIVVLIGALAGTAHAEIIDRVLAVVGSRIITLSDARAALAFGLVNPPPTGDRVLAAMSSLIDRELMLAEVQRYLPAEPPPVSIDAGVAAIRSRFPTSAAFDAALAITGLSAGQVRELVRDGLRIEAYIEDRFASALQPADRQARVADWLGGLRRRANVTELYLPAPR